MSDTLKPIVIAAGESPDKTSSGCDCPARSNWVDLYEEGIDLDFVPQSKLTQSLFEVAQSGGAKNILSLDDFRRQMREFTAEERSIERQAQWFLGNAVELIKRITGKRPSTDAKGRYREKLDPFEKQC